MTSPLTDQQLDELQPLAARITGDPFLVSDCEGELAVWREKALLRVTRDESGTIVGYSLPASYRSADEVIETMHLDSWDPGEDTDDDQCRQDINDLVDARAALPALLAEVRRLAAELAEYEPLNPQQCPKGVHADWLVDSEYTHACPWCQIDDLRAASPASAGR